MACKAGSLNFINDYLFAEPVVCISERWNIEKRNCYRFVIDEPNPWRPSTGAHHGVDVLLLFGNYDFTSYPAAETTGRELRKRWIMFVNGEKPWSSAAYAFGPDGKCGEVGTEEIVVKRRGEKLEYLSKLRPKPNSVLGSLVAGRISLEKGQDRS